MSRQTAGLVLAVVVGLLIWGVVPLLWAATA